jgi:hypothetical protein
VKLMNSKGVKLPPVSSISRQQLNGHISVFHILSKIRSKGRELCTLYFLISKIYF